MHVRAVKMKRDGEQYGEYYQLVRSYRDPKTRKPKQEVLVHLGHHPTPEKALHEWPKEAEILARHGRPKQAGKLETKCEKLAQVWRAENHEEKGR